MRKIRSVGFSLLFLILVAVLTFSILTVVTDIGSEDSERTQGNTNSSNKALQQEIKLVTLGDSLTEGVGDSSQRGGYVPLAANLLEDTELFSQVETVNAGKSGAVVSEVMELIHQDEQLKRDISTADIIVLSVGGNNLVHAFTQTGLNAPEEAFEMPMTKYQQDLSSLFEEIRGWNEDVPVYIFGIYNPYYHYFTEIEPLQKIVDAWNTKTEETADQFDQTFFIPIDHLFNTSENVVSGEDVEEPTEGSSENHPYLFQGDYFHPNDEGYRLMADALVQRIEETWNVEETMAEEE